jgi:MFS transporter, AAHS family, benzoate transport protein
VTGFWLTSFLCQFMIYGLNTWLPQIMRQAGYSLGRR